RSFLPQEPKSAVEDLAALVPKFKALMEEWLVLRWKPDGYPGSLTQFLTDREFKADIISTAPDNPFRPVVQALAQQLLGLRQRHVVTGKETNKYLTVEQVDALLGTRGPGMVRKWVAQGLVVKARDAAPMPMPELPAGLTAEQVAERWREEGYRGGLLNWLEAYFPPEEGRLDPTSVG